MIPNGPPPQSTEPGMDSRARELQREFQSDSTKSDSTTRVSYRINYANLVYIIVVVGIALLLFLIAILVLWLVNPSPYPVPIP
jgi:uncharacterized membrane protein